MEASEVKAQFNVFEDYLGLINIIRPSHCPSSMKANSCESLVSTSLFDFPPERHRINSLDSDSLSDSSSNSGSRDIDMIYDSLSSNGDFSNYSNIPSPPMSTMNEPMLPVYNATLETLLACQKSVLSRLQPMMKESRSSKNTSKTTVCVFCRNNGESREFYSSHTLKDSEGNTACPILRAYTCPLCKANGDNSHTIKYCPKYTPKLKAEKLLAVGLSM